MAQMSMCELAIAAVNGINALLGEDNLNREEIEAVLELIKGILEAPILAHEDGLD